MRMMWTAVGAKFKLRWLPFRQDFLCSHWTVTFATAARLNKFQPTFQTVFSDENVQQCQEKLSKIQPVRRMWMGRNRKQVAQAAVLIPLCKINGEPSVLFTKRSEHLYNHRGQVSFPGGKVDETDMDRISTAIRESEEEIGLDPDKVDTWGTMATVPGRNFEIAVTPVMAYCGELDWSELKINSDEVSEVFTHTVEALCDPSSAGYTHFRGDEQNYRLPVYTLGKHSHRIWGLTAVILHMALTVLAPGLYKHPSIL